MHNKKLATALTVAGVAIAAAVLIVLVSSKDESQSGNATGVVNPEASAVGATREAAPQLSTEGFELPPSVGTGSYTKPEHRQHTQNK
jgi:hypothetical protein